MNGICDVAHVLDIYSFLNPHQRYFVLFSEN
jgi:hypothetical protein